jgi:NAD(P)H-flavin reductase
MPTSTLVSDSAKLPEEAIALLEKADLFFMTTINGDTDMDCNHRGGPPGFIRLFFNDPAVLVYPEYSGNRLYSSLGNLMQDPRIGIVVPDFDTGDALYLTGTAAILIGHDAAAVMPRSQLAVRITAASARFVRRTLALRGAPGEPSPYNPAVRLLAREGALLAQHAAGAPSRGEATVLKVAARVDLTPTIARYELRRVAGPSLRWRPGQWVALDFSAELDQGYSHMRDDDPQSINDDFTRTFTISSYPRGGTDDAVELTLRTNGPVTNMLRRRRLDGRSSSLEIAVRGVGGQFELPKKDDFVFLAGGVGITPLLGQLAGMDAERVKVGWVIKSEDVSFVLDVLRKYPGITNGMAIFFTGHWSAANQDMMEVVSRMGAKVWNRRITRDDLTNFETSSKWYLCAGKGLRKQLLEWRPEKEVVFENFDY